MISAMYKGTGNFGEERCFFISKCCTSFHLVWLKNIKNVCEYVVSYRYQVVYVLYVFWRLIWVIFLRQGSFYNDSFVVVIVIIVYPNGIWCKQKICCINLVHSFGHIQFICSHNIHSTVRIYHWYLILVYMWTLWQQFNDRFDDSTSRYDDGVDSHKL